MRRAIKPLFPLLFYVNPAVVVTLVGVICGAVGVCLAVAGRLEWAVMLVLVGVVCDQIDGPIARKLDVVSDFGGNLDIFGDFLLYVCFPAAFILNFLSFSLLAFVLAALVVVVGAMRLAYCASEKVKDIVIGIPLSLCVFPICLYALYWGGPAEIIPAVSLTIVSVLFWLSACKTKRNSLLGGLSALMAVATFVGVAIGLYN